MENQRFEIRAFCKANGIKVNTWIEETTSGTKAYQKRMLGLLLHHVREGDLIICSELSRLGRSFFMIMEILSTCMNKGVKVWTIKDGYRLGDDLQSKVLAFAFSISAEIERNLISQRTKEALALRRAMGIQLGRRKGSGKTATQTGEEPKEETIESLLRQRMTPNQIAERLGLEPKTVARYVKRLNHLRAHDGLLQKERNPFMNTRHIFI